MSMLAGVILHDTYRIEGRVGEGGMGDVYLATHVRLPDKRYAIKVLRGAATPSTLVRFRREAEIATKLAHPHIVEVHDFHTTDGGEPYLVMELLEGEDLAHRLERTGGLPLPEVRRIVGEIASALDAAHAIGVVHRDLKPHNIFLCRRPGRDDVVKLCDFGISKVIDAPIAVTQETTLVGTVPYMSPEQARGDIVLDARSDVFALGAIVWEMLTGRMAFLGPTLHATLANVLSVEPPPVHTLRRELSPAVSEVLARALAKDRNLRTPSAGELARALDQTLVAAPAVGFAPTLPGPSPLRRRPRIAWIVAAAVIAIGAIATAAVLLSDGSSPPVAVAPSDAAAPIFVDDSCAAVADRLAAFVRASGEPGSRDADVVHDIFTKCDHDWSPEVRHCTATAADLAAASVCVVTSLRGDRGARVARICRELTTRTHKAVDHCVKEVAEELASCPDPDPALDCFAKLRDWGDAASCGCHPDAAVADDSCEALAPHVIALARGVGAPARTDDVARVIEVCHGTLDGDERHCLAAAQTYAAAVVCDHKHLDVAVRPRVGEICDALPRTLGRPQDPDAYSACVDSLDKLLPRCGDAAAVLDCFARLTSWEARGACAIGCSFDADCTPPYTDDDAGVRRYDPRCL